MENNFFHGLPPFVRLTFPFHLYVFRMKFILLDRKKIFQGPYTANTYHCTNTFGTYITYILPKMADLTLSALHGASIYS